MLRFATVYLCAGLCLAQAPAKKPPARVDQALRARITEFYQDFVDGKFRQAEVLVAEDSKDAYYNGQKAKYRKFMLRSIEYRDKFTRAKVVTMCDAEVPILGFAGQWMTVPITSSWKLEHGSWYWYLDAEELSKTPFGESKTDPNAHSGPLPAAIPNDTGYVLQRVKPDKTELALKAGETGVVTFTNTAPGPMILSLAGRLSNVDAALDRMNLQPGEKAVLTVQPHADARGGALNLHVEPTDELITLEIKIEK